MPYRNSILSKTSFIKQNLRRNEMNDHDEHYKMWDWLSKNPDKSKKDYFEENFTVNYIRPVNYCFLCDLYYDYKSCEKCPMVKKHGCVCVSSTSLFLRWCDTKDSDNKEDRIKYAKAIRDVVDKPE